MAMPTTQRVTLTEVYNVLRNFAGVEVYFTSIGDGLYLTSPQICELLGITPKAVRNHSDTIYQEITGNKGGGVGRPPLYLTIYEAEVQFQSRTSVGGGGGNQTQKFYHHELVIRIAERMMNTDRKMAVLNWMREIVSQYVQHGFVIDDHAVAVDDRVFNSLNTRVIAYNFSPERQAMVELNKRVSLVFGRCAGIYAQDGTLSYPAWDYFHRCCHNTAHISAVGLTALQLRAARADPNILTFGQVNYRGKLAPQTGELKNACNFLTNNELDVRAYVLSAALSRVMVYMDTNGQINYQTALKIITMHSVSQYVPFVSWDFRDYPDTALDNIVNLADKSLLRAKTRVALEMYLTNFPNRHQLVGQVAVQYNEAVQTLVNASIEFDNP